MIPLPTKILTCPHCQQPYGGLNPIGATPSIDNNGKKLVPGTLSEKPAVQKTAPVRQPGFMDLFAPLTELQQAPVPPDKQIAGTPQDVPMVVQPFEQKPQAVARQPSTSDPFDDPIIGGRVAICILMYGDYYDLHTRCLNSIISTVPASRRQVRVATNAVCNQTLQYLSRLQSEGQVHKVLVNPTNIKKYPAMRRMFYDGNDLINDKWVIWFDDDSIADRDPEWCPKLLKTIISNYDAGFRFFGAAHIWSFKSQQIAWVKSRPWYRNRPFQMKNGNEAPNGNNVIFPAGGFWALETDALRKAGIPDETIGHNGGDYMLAEQLWQLGGRMKNWNGQKQFIHTSSVKRRGITEMHTGMSGWKPGGATT